MVSHAKLSIATLKRYYNDATFRDKRMQKFVVSDLAININTSTMTEMLPEVDYIKSFHQRQQLAQGKDLDDRVVATEKVGLDTHSGNSKAAVLLYQSMQRAIDESSLEEEDTKSIKPMMVALPDPVGEVIAAAEKRNYLLKKLDDAQKDETNVRQQVNAIIIDNIRSSLEASNQSSIQEAIGNSRAGLGANHKAQAAIGRNIYKYINKNKFKAVLAKAKKSRKDKQAISQIRETFKKVFNSAEFKDILKQDFTDDLISHVGLCKIVAQTTNGIGIDEKNLGIPDILWSDYKPDESSGMTAKQEFEQTLLPYIRNEGSSQDNILFKALIGLNPDHLEAIAHPPEPEPLPRFDKLDRFSEFAVASTNWFRQFYINRANDAINKANIAQSNKHIEAEKQRIQAYDAARNEKIAARTKQQTAIDNTHNKALQSLEANMRPMVNDINHLASNKAQLIQTLSHCQSYLKSNNSLINNISMWTQASIFQDTKLSLAHIAYRDFPIGAINQFGNDYINNAINDAKQNKGPVPSGINSGEAINAQSLFSNKSPVAIDLSVSHGVDPSAQFIYDDAIYGKRRANLILSQYVGEGYAQQYAKISQQIETKAQKLNASLDEYKAISAKDTKLMDYSFEPYRAFAEPESQSLLKAGAGKSALLSSGIAVFQMRSIIKSNEIKSIMQRGDRDALEFTTGYSSTVLAFTTASLDTSSAVLQMRASQSLWAARLTFSAGVLGAVGAGFEVYSLNIARQKHVENESRVSRRATNIAIGAAGVAGVSGMAIALGFTMPWLLGVMAAAWGISLIAQWVAFRYDKSNILPIHYWLDAGVFGNQEMLNDDYPNNPFKIRAMENLQEDLHAYTLALIEIQLKPRFKRHSEGFDEILTGQVEVIISQWRENSELEIHYIGINDQALGLDRQQYSISALKNQNKAVITDEGLKVTLDIPKTKHFKGQYIGSAREGTLNPHTQQRMQEARQRAKDNLDVQIEKLRTVVFYSFNPSVNPHYQLRTTITS